MHLCAQSSVRSADFEAERAPTTERDSDRFFVVTGGPGSGKTAVVDALAAAGYAVCAESARRIVRDQLAIGGSALPWRDRALYAELLLSSEVRSHRLACDERGVVVFDRGLPDVVAMSRLAGREVPRHFERAAEQYRYNARVFIAPPWREIFVRDGERKQSFADAARAYEVVAETYTRCGYELIELPRVSVVDRAEIVADAALGTERRLWAQKGPARLERPSRSPVSRLRAVG
jgi:predicted ATPase